MSTVIRIGQIGAGAIGIHHLGDFQRHPQAQVLAVAEVSPERRQEAATKFDVPYTYADYKELLARPDLDAVSIALPNYLHAPVTLEALAAGKHVMLDKPMATNAADGEKMLALAKAKGLTLMVGQNQRFLPAVQTLRQMIEAGRLGEVYHAKAQWLRRSGIPRIGSWFTQKEFAGGGCTYDIGVHVLDQALYLMGEFDAVAVSGQTYAKFGPRGLGDGSWGKGEIDPNKPFTVDDLSLALIKLRSGRTVLLEVSWAVHQEAANVNGVQVFGTEAGATTEPFRVFRNGAEGYVHEFPAAKAPYADPNRMIHFVDVLLGKAKPFVLPEESLGVQRILDAIYTSAETGREVTLA